MSSERARAAYLECQIQDMGSVWLPLNIPLMEEESHASSDLTRRINIFVRNEKREEDRNGNLIDKH